MIRRAFFKDTHPTCTQPMPGDLVSYRVKAEPTGVVMNWGIVIGNFGPATDRDSDLRVAVDVLWADSDFFDEGRPIELTRLFLEER